MRKITGLLFLTLICSGILNAQIDNQLKTDIANTGYIHTPLPPDHSNSFESFGFTKKVHASVPPTNIETLGKGTATDDSLTFDMDDWILII